jgi:hypothetical protein
MSWEVLVVGPGDPELWLVILAASSALLGLAREKIRADRDRALAELALRDAKPSERGKIIESLAKTKQFSPLQLPRRAGHNVKPKREDEPA